MGWPGRAGQDRESWILELDYFPSSNFKIKSGIMQRAYSVFMLKHVPDKIILCEAT